MARILLTEAEANRIIAAHKRIRGDVRWEYSQHEGFVKCELVIENTLGANLKLIGNVNMEEPTIYSFSLILSNAYRIRGLDVSGSHKNKHTDSNEWRAATHKHSWSDRCREAFAYTLRENILAGEIGETFKIFCQECNIDFQGRVLTLPPKQLNMRL